MAACPLYADRRGHQSDETSHRKSLPADRAVSHTHSRYAAEMYFLTCTSQFCSIISANGTSADDSVSHIVTCIYKSVKLSFTLYFYHLTIVGHLDSGGQRGVDLGMTADVVAGMDEPRLAGPYPTGKGYGLVERLVGVMGLLAQGVDNEGVAAFDIGNLTLVDGFHIGDVGQRTDAVAQDRQVMVHDLEGNDVEVANAEGLVLVNLVELDGGNTWIAVLGKAVRQHLEHASAGYGVGIDIDFTKLAIGTDIVHAAHVVVVGVGDEDAVNLAEGLRHDLLTEVGATVDEQARLFRLDECRAAQALVVRVGAAAGIALAADGGHTTRCSGS